MIHSMSKSLVMVRGGGAQPYPKNSGIVVLLIIIPTTCGLHADVVVLMCEPVHLTSQFVTTKGCGEEIRLNRFHFKSDNCEEGAAAFCWLRVEVGENV